MKLRPLASVFIFLSAYSPLSIIFLIQDIDFNTLNLQHPKIVWTVIGVALLSCLIVWISVKSPKVSTPPVKIISSSNQSGELINYSIPYMITFFVMDLGNLKLILSFAFFMLLMYWLTIKTHNVFTNPILAFIGYNIYEVRFLQDNLEYESFFLAKGGRLVPNERYRILQITDRLYLVTERNPEI